jgi:cell wall-associated NlpC family hydrolase
MTLVEFAARAATVPFVDRGRTWHGWDCYGLVYRAYADVLGIALPSYVERSPPADAHEDVAALIRREIADWARVAVPRPSDGVLLRLGSHACHVGLVLGAGRFLHAMEGLGTCAERLDGPHWRNRVVGFYRNREARTGACQDAA